VDKATVNAYDKGVESLQSPEHVALDGPAKDKAGTMTGRAAVRRPAQPPQPRGLRRGSLTPELIVKESLRLLDSDTGFSLPKLGRALGADPTAVYRHFPSKDDLVLAIADALIEEATAGVSLQDCWVDTLAESARRLRRTYLAHPAAAALSACRTTQRPAEMRIVNVIIGAVRAAGFEGAEAAVVYRALGDFSLYWSGGEAAFWALDEKAQQTDRAAWTRAYLAAGEDEFPHIFAVRDELPKVADDDIFETILSLVLAGLMRRAPRPCDCGTHQ